MRLGRRGIGREEPLGPLLRVAVAGARADAGALRRAVLALRASGAPRRALEETALMLVLYVGYPAALETLRVVRESWPGHARRSREGTPAVWRRRGVALCRRVYGPVYPRLMDAVRRLHPDLAAWMVDTGYGRVLSRPGLSVPARGLITVAVLAATGRERQLVSHLLGAARVGAGGTALRRALAIGATSATGLARARRAWRTAFGTALTSSGSRP